MDDPGPLRIRRGAAAPSRLMEKMGYEPQPGDGQATRRIDAVHHVDTTSAIGTPYKFDVILGENDGHGHRYLKHMRKTARAIAKRARKNPQMRVKGRWEERIMENRLTDLGSMVIFLDVNKLFSDPSDLDRPDDYEQETEEHALAAVHRTFVHLYRTHSFDLPGTPVEKFLMDGEGRAYTSISILETLSAIYNWNLESYVKDWGLRGFPVPPDIEGADNVWRQHISPARPLMALAWGLYAADLMRSWISDLRIRDFKTVTGIAPLSFVSDTGEARPARLVRVGIEKIADDIATKMMGRFLTSGVTTPSLMAKYTYSPRMGQLARALVHVLDPYSYESQVSKPPVPDSLKAAGLTKMAEEALHSVWRDRVFLPLLNRIRGVYKLLIFYYPDADFMQQVFAPETNLLQRLTWVEHKEVCELATAFSTEMTRIANINPRGATRRSKRLRGIGPGGSLVREHPGPAISRMAAAWAMVVYDGIRLSIPHAPDRKFATAMSQLDGDGDMPLWLAPMLSARHNIQVLVGVDEELSDMPHDLFAASVATAMGTHRKLVVMAAAAAAVDAPMLPDYIEYRPPGAKVDARDGSGARSLRWFHQYLEVLRLFAVVPRASVFQTVTTGLRALNSRLDPLESGFFYHIIHKHWILEAEAEAGVGGGPSPPSAWATAALANDYASDYRAGLTSPEAILRFSAWRTAAALVRVARGHLRVTGVPTYRRGARDRVLEPLTYLSAEDLPIAAYFAMWLASSPEELYDPRYGGTGYRTGVPTSEVLAGIFNHPANKAPAERYRRYVQEPVRAWLETIERGDTARERVPSAHSLRPTATLGLARPAATASFVDLMGRAAVAIQLGQMDVRAYAKVFRDPNRVYTYDMRQLPPPIREGAAAAAAEAEGGPTPAIEDEIWQRLGEDVKRELRETYRPLLWRVTAWFADIDEAYVHGALERTPAVKDVMIFKDAVMQRMLYDVPPQTTLSDVHSIVANVMASKNRHHPLRSEACLEALNVIRGAVLREAMGSGYDYDKLFSAHIVGWTAAILKYIAEHTGISFQDPMDYEAAILLHTRERSSIWATAARSWVENLRLAHHVLMMRSILSANRPPAQGVLRRWRRAMAVVNVVARRRSEDRHVAAQIVLYRMEVRVATPYRLLDPIMGVVHHMVSIGSETPPFSSDWTQRHAYANPLNATDRDAGAAMALVRAQILHSGIWEPLEDGFVELVVYPLWIASREAPRDGGADRAYRIQCWLLAATLVRVASGRIHRGSATRLARNHRIANPDDTDPPAQAYQFPRNRLQAGELATAALVAMGLYEYMGPDRLAGNRDVEGDGGFYSAFTPALLRRYDHVFLYPMWREAARRSARLQENIDRRNVGGIQ